MFDVFQEHVAFCHDVVLLSKSRRGIKISGKGPAQPALGARCCFQNRWKLGANEGHFQSQKENYCLVSDLINLFFCSHGTEKSMFNMCTAYMNTRYPNCITQRAHTPSTTCSSSPGERTHLLFLEDGFLVQHFHCIKSPITLAFGQENLQQKVLVTAVSLTLVSVSSLARHSYEGSYTENCFREPGTGF